MPPSPNSNIESSGVARAPNDCEEIEKTLKRQIEETKAFLASIGDGVVATDNEGRIIFINQAATDMTQWEISDATGKSWGDLVGVEDERGSKVPIEKRAIMQALATKKIIATQYYYYRKDKSKFLASTTANPVKIDGVITGAILTFRDITREKEIDWAKTEFVSLASHQLRTPLATISWYTELILSGEVGKSLAKQQRYLHEIYNANQRMTDLINALLNVSRIEMGTFVYAAGPIDFNRIFDRIMEDLNLKIRVKKLKIEKRVDPRLKHTVTDTHVIEIILQNLLSNAVKYTPEGGKIKTLIERRDKKIYIEIKDSGYGIPAEQQKHIFEKFFRGDNIREKDTEGTGLGLYIVKALVNRLGGQIGFESVENQGTTFYVNIPLNHGSGASV